MKLDDLTEEHLVEIVRLYEKRCGGPKKREFSRAMYQAPELVLRHLKKHGREEYMVGSRWDSASKIYFKTDSEGNVAVDFNPNFSPWDSNEVKHRSAKRGGREFLKAAMQYLQGKQYS